MGAEISGVMRSRGWRLAISILVIAAAFVAGFVLRGGEERGQGRSENAAGPDGHAEQQPGLWTCSMHPDIKLPKEGKCPICFMDLIPLETQGLDEEIGERQLRMTEAAVKLASIVTTPAVRMEVRVERAMTGAVGYDETRVSHITSRFAGRLEKLYLDQNGMDVKEGEGIAEIYSPELISAQEELIQAAKAAGTLSVTQKSALGSSASRTLEAAREKLSLYGLTDEQISEIESSGQTRDRMKIYSPMAGTVVEKKAVEGMYVATGTRIYTIADLSTVWVELDAYQPDIPWMRKGLKASFTSLSIPGKIFEGTVSFIDPVLDPATRTAKVRVEVENRGRLLKPGMFVSGTVQSILEGSFTRDGKMLVIPATAPLLTGKRAVVYVRLPGGDQPVFEGREVELGPRAGDHYPVLSGIEEGELVVVNGAFKIDSELQIHARPSMMNPAGGGPAPGHDHGAEGIAGHGGHDAEMSGVHGGHDAEMAGGHGGKVDSSDEAASALTAVYQAYFDVQMALASDDLDLARKGNAALEKVVKQIDTGLFKGGGLEKWMKISAELLKRSRAGSLSGDIVQCRKEFDHLSAAMIEMHGIFGHSEDKEYFLTYCPMAFGDRGAFWLQEVDTVYNSHYGASMLRCGEIRETLERRK